MKNIDNIDNASSAFGSTEDHNNDAGIIATAGETNERGTHLHVL
jgi:hypothetical protein